MRYLKLNRTDLEVSALCLGAGPFGTSVPKDQAFSQLDAFVTLGGNFLDTAHIYGDWGPGEKALSEKIIGQWMESRRCRKDVVISTKGGHPLLSTMEVSRVLLPELEIDLQGSLEALRTNSIDIYFLHRDNPQVPVAEIVDWLEEQKTGGRIRYYGCSNWSLQRIVEAQQYAGSKGYTGLICNQILDSLADINRESTTRMQMVVADQAFDAYHRQSGMNLMAYMAVAHGYFAKKEANIALSDSARALFEFPQNQKMLEVMLTHKPYSVNDFVYQYILQRPYPSIPITAFRNLDQMKQSIASCEVEMPKELVEQVSSYKLRRD
jgi:aryl-alcohol dehydrogenase-like predicted oxidoreductase